jgi:hypothetical protein
MRIRRSHDSLLNRISSGMCESANEIHRFELERFGRRAAAAFEFQEMLTNLKDRLAQKASLFTQPTFAGQCFVLPHKAA